VPNKFIREAWSHGKAITAIGSGSQVLKSAGFRADNTMGIFATVTAQVLDALSGPVRFLWRF
jgi:putative intracellular protease/amidase